MREGLRPAGSLVWISDRLCPSGTAPGCSVIVDMGGRGEGARHTIMPRAYGKCASALPAVSKAPATNEHEIKGKGSYVCPHLPTGGVKASTTLLDEAVVRACNVQRVGHAR
jgi:hypothetical protein